MKARTYAWMLMLFGSQRLLELAYSARNERRIAARQPGVPMAGRSVWPWIAALNLALFTLPAIERGWRRRPAPGVISALGWTLALSGVALRVAVIASLRQSWNVRALVPDDLQVVDHGPYRFIRHPNYVALGFEFLGLPLIGGAYLSAVALGAANAALLARRVQEEEALLMAIPGYRERMAGKPRFVPRRLSAR